MIAKRLPDEMEKRLSEMARTTGRTTTFHVREAILEYLDDLEDTCLAGRRPGAHSAGKTRFSSIADLERELGLMD